MHDKLSAWAVRDPIFPNNFWASHTLLDLAPGGTLPDPDPRPYRNPPWIQHPINPKIHHPYTSKKDLNKDTVYNTAFQNVSEVKRSADHVYYTDGSVTGCLVSSAFCTGTYSKGVQLEDGATILQAELAAISLALRHAVHQGYGQTVLHTDSLAAIHFLSKHSPNDNISFYNAVMEAAILLPHPHILNWVSSLVGLVGNEMADRAATRHPFP